MSVPVGERPVFSQTPCCQAGLVSAAESALDSKKRKLDPKALTEKVQRAIDDNFSDLSAAQIDGRTRQLAACGGDYSVRPLAARLIPPLEGCGFVAPRASRTRHFEADAMWPRCVAAFRWVVHVL